MCARLSNLNSHARCTKSVNNRPDQFSQEKIKTAKRLRGRTGQDGNMYGEMGYNRAAPGPLHRLCIYGNVAINTQTRTGMSKGLLPLARSLTRDLETDQSNVPQRPSAAAISFSLCGCGCRNTLPFAYIPMPRRYSAMRPHRRTVSKLSA